MVPVARRDARRLAMMEQVRGEMETEGRLPQDPDLAAQAVAQEVRARVRTSGRSNISRAVSDLVRAGFLRRHYQGYRVDHENRGPGERPSIRSCPPSNVLLESLTERSGLKKPWSCLLRAWLHFSSIKAPPPGRSGPGGGVGYDGERSFTPLAQARQRAWPHAPYGVAWPSPWFWRAQLPLWQRKKMP
jgi:hypothetical protein